MLQAMDRSKCPEKEKESLKVWCNAGAYTLLKSEERFLFKQSHSVLPGEALLYSSIYDYSLIK
jgi:hypothetical protein